MLQQELSRFGVATDWVDVADLDGVRRALATPAGVLYVETLSNPVVLERLAREAGVRVRGRLYADALSRPDGPAATYEAMIRHNVTMLTEAMRGG